MKLITDSIAPIGKKGLHILQTGDWRTKRPILDQEKCIHCGICYLYCPVNSVIKKADQFLINYDYCKGCGVCAHECPRDAIEMIEEVEK